MDQQNNGSSPKPPSPPSHASMLARGLPPPSFPLSRTTYITVFIDPIDGHLAHLPIPAMGLDPEELVNPRAVAYKVPARYKVSAKTFADAAAKSLSAVINPTNGPSIAKPFLSTIRHPGTEFDRIEIVYHEDLDAFEVSTTPIVFKKNEVPTPLFQHCLHGHQDHVLRVPVPNLSIFRRQSLRLGQKVAGNRETHG